MSSKIGLVGAPGAGKDFLADHLVGKGFVKLAFADQIKNEYYKASGFSEEQFKQARGTGLEKFIRDGLWKYSDEMRRLHGSLYFISPVIRKMVHKRGEFVVVSDVRTQEELGEMRQTEARIVVVVRDLAVKDGTIPGTRIPFSSIQGESVFWNWSESIETAHAEWEEFCLREFGWRL